MKEIMYNDEFKFCYDQRSIIMLLTIFILIEH